MRLSLTLSFFFSAVSFVQACNFFQPGPIQTWICGDMLCVPNRYIPYSLLTDDQKSSVGRLGYTECSWNVPGGNPIELNYFYGLYQREIFAARSLEFSYPSWDCWVNHYAAYEWEELFDLTYFDEVGSCMVALGWSEESWNEEANGPESSFKSWADLTDDERAGAECICYTESTWDVKQIGVDFDASFCETDIPSAPVECDAKDIFTSIECVDSRYREWSGLLGITKTMLSAFGYNESSWDDLSAPPAIEQLAFSSLDIEDQKTLTTVLGVNEKSWDCYISHFAEYSWVDLGKVYVDDCYTTLGYNEAMWEGDVEIDFIATLGTWDELGADEKAAAECVCYTKSTWDGDSITSADFVSPCA